MGASEQYIPLSEIDRKIAALEEQLAKLPLELEILRRLRTHAMPLPNDGHVEAPFTGKLGPKQAVLRFLAAQDDPIKVSELVRRVEPTVESAASDVKRTLYSTVNNLKAAELVSVIDGYASITKEGLKEVGSRHGKKAEFNSALNSP